MRRRAGASSSRRMTSSPRRQASPSMRQRTLPSVWRAVSDVSTLWWREGRRGSGKVSNSEDGLANGLFIFLLIWIKCDYGDEVASDWMCLDFKFCFFYWLLWLL